MTAVNIPSLLLLTLLFAFVVAPSSPATLAQEGSASTRVGFVHGSPDVPVIDIYVDGTLEVDDLGYGETTEFIELPAGDHRFAVTQAGNEPDAVIASATEELRPNAVYALATIGLLQEIELRTWQADLTPVRGSQGRVRVVHASPDAPAVDIGVAGGDVLIAGATFHRAPEAVAVEASTYDLEMRLADSREVVQTIPDVSVPANTVTMVFAVGLLEDDGALEVLALVADLNDFLLPATGVGLTTSGEGASSGQVAFLALLGAAIVALGGLWMRSVGRLS